MNIGPDIDSIEVGRLKYFIKNEKRQNLSVALRPEEKREWGGREV